MAPPNPKFIEIPFDLVSYLIRNNIKTGVNNEVKSSPSIKFKMHANCASQLLYINLYLYFPLITSIYHAAPGDKDKFSIFNKTRYWKATI